MSPADIPRETIAGEKMARVNDMIGRFLRCHCDNTRLAYTDDLNCFADALGKSLPAAIAIFLDASPNDRAEIVERYKGGLHGISLRTYRRRMSILRNISSFAWREGIVRERIDLNLSIPRYLGQLEAAKKHLAMPPMQRYVHSVRASVAADHTLYGLRDLAIFDLIFFGLVRSWEVRALKRYQIDLPQKEVWVGKSETGGCRFGLPEIACASLAAWLSEHPDPECPFVFVRLHGRFGPFSRQGLRWVLEKRSREVGLKSPISTRGLLHASILQAKDELRFCRAWSQVFASARRRRQAEREVARMSHDGAPEGRALASIPTPPPGNVDPAVDLARSARPARGD